MTEKEREIMITLLCASQVLHEALDELQHIKFYKHTLKLAAKRLEEEITKVCDPIIKEVHPNDEEMFNLIGQGIENISKELATLNPSVIAKVGMLIEEQKNHHTNEEDRHNEGASESRTSSSPEG